MWLLSRVIMTERAPLPVLSKAHAPPPRPVFNFIVKSSYEEAFSSASSLAGKESFVGGERIIVLFCPCHLLSPSEALTAGHFLSSEGTLKRDIL